MSTNHFKNAAVVISIFALGIFIGGIPGYGQSEREIPAEDKGVRVTLLGVVAEQSLEKQVGLSGYELRLREFVVEPGGEVTRHSHASRPGVQTISGPWTVGRMAGEDAEPIVTEYPGDKRSVLVETWDTDHWGWNTGSEPVRILACDLAPVS